MHPVAYVVFSSPVVNIHCYGLSSFPQATESTLLEKFKQQHQDNAFFVQTPVREPAFVIRHFAGKVKYQIKVKEQTLKLNFPFEQTFGVELQMMCLWWETLRSICVVAAL